MRKYFVPIFLALLLSLPGNLSAQAREVVIYTSVDQIYSEPILKDFETKTGITVNAVYDVEAAKTTGLVNRLIAEKDHPKCDVFWNSEVGRTITMKRQGILSPYESPSAADIPKRFKDPEHFWTGFALRARILIYNTKLLQENELPKSIFELTHEKWKGKVALSNPLFGTAAPQVAALYVLLGKDKAEAYLKALKDNGVLIVDGNSVTRDMVVDGELPIAFTDTDDAHIALLQKKSVAIIYPDQGGIGTFLFPNTVALIQNAPHAAEARMLIDFLLNPAVESKLAFGEAGEIPVRSGVSKPSDMPDISSITVMDVDYEQVADFMDEAARFSQKLFVR